MTPHKRDPGITPDGEPPDPGLPPDGGAGGGALPDPRRTPPALRGGLLTPREEQRLQQKELQRALKRPDVQTTADARRALAEQRGREVEPALNPRRLTIGDPLSDGPDGQVGPAAFTAGFDVEVSPPAERDTEPVVELPAFDILGGLGLSDEQGPLF